MITEEHRVVVEELTDSLRDRSVSSESASEDKIHREPLTFPRLAGSKRPEDRGR